MPKPFLSPCCRPRYLIFAFFDISLITSGCSLVGSLLQLVLHHLHGHVRQEYVVVQRLDAMKWICLVLSL